MNKKTLVLGGVLIILIALAYLYQGPLKKWQNSLGKTKNIFAKIDTVKVDKIEVIVDGKATVLSKLGEKWKYNDSKDFYVDSAIMSNILGSLEKAKASELELVSDNAERKSEFKTDDTGLTVNLYEGNKKIVDFIIGLEASNYSDSYIATPGSRATYSVKVNLASVFKQTEWRDLTIFSTAQDKIEKIRFQYPNREFTVEAKAGKWAGILPEKFTVNQEKINKLAQIMANLKAVEIPEQVFTGTGLEKHSIIVEATGAGIDNVLMIGGNRQELSYAKRGESDNIYLINKSDRDELDKWIWQLR